MLCPRPWLALFPFSRFSLISSTLAHWQPSGTKDLIHAGSGFFHAPVGLQAYCTTSNYGVLPMPRPPPSGSGGRPPSNYPFRRFSPFRMASPCTEYMCRRMAIFVFQILWRFRRPSCSVHVAWVLATQRAVWAAASWLAGLVIN
jgi:hypothetical protein